MAFLKNLNQSERIRPLIGKLMWIKLKLYN